jgi:hypothetical protein
MRSQTCGSEMFGTEEMKTDEVVMFAITLKENGADAEETNATIGFIDSLLWYKKRQLFLNKETSKTRTGNYRRNSGYMEFMEKGIESLVAELRKPEL